MIFFFDVDGTLTPSRGLIDTEFHDWFLDWIQSHQVCLVTGSDRAKTREQLGDLIVDSVDYCFNCSGNVVYRKNEMIYASDWKLSDEQRQWLVSQLDSSSYPHRFGQHIEDRIGTVNFSVVGRGATGNDRTDYFVWDQKNHERARIAESFKQMFPFLDAQVGGETGIDIFPLGKDKSQVLKWVSGTTVMFGDRCEKGGNDYPLAKLVDKLHHVSGWQETWRILLEHYDH